MKTYVLTVSKTFPINHIRKGEPTNFHTFLTYGTKKHTIRGNYAFWKKRVDEVNAGIAILSVREWSGKPYCSKQIEIREYSKLGIQECDVAVNEKTQHIAIIINGKEKIFVKNAIITNDGLSWEDFRAWFKKPIVNGCIIHFTDLRY